MPNKFLDTLTLHPGATVTVVWTDRGGRSGGSMTMDAHRVLAELTAAAAAAPAAAAATAADLNIKTCSECGSKLPPRAHADFFGHCSLACLKALIKRYEPEDRLTAATGPAAAPIRGPIFGKKGIFD